VNHRSLAFRLAVWYALLLSATFALVAAGMYFALAQYLRSSLSDSLHRRSVQVEQILQTAAANATDSEISNQIDTRVAPEFNNRFVRVTRAPDLTRAPVPPVYRSGPPADRSFDPESIPPLGNIWPVHATTRRVDTVDGPILISATPVATASGRYLVELGSSLAPSDVIQDRLLTLLGILLPILIACAAGGGYLLVQRALRPVERMSQTAAHISVQNLDARLPVEPTGDALQELSLSLNHMLGRLRESVQTSRRFLADASHELRTPLTIIKGELQEIVRGADCPPELRERIGSTLEEVARLERLVSGLLALSRLDAGDAQREWLVVDLGALAASTVEQMRLVAEDRGVHLEASGLRPLLVRGDRGRLKQVIVNLLDNAIKFTPRGGRVTLTSEQRPGIGILEVRDTGIGIPQEALPHLFERFFRVDEARARPNAADDPATGGAGLGLSIVQSICTAHGADIEVESSPELGSCFRLKFPRPPSLLGTSAGALPRAMAASSRESATPMPLGTSAFSALAWPTEWSRCFSPGAMIRAVLLSPPCASAPLFAPGFPL
jgi:heavy metal sensor kinase